MSGSPPPEPQYISLKRYLEIAELPPLTINPKLHNLGLDGGAKGWASFGRDEAMWREKGFRVLKNVYPAEHEELNASVKDFYSTARDDTVVLSDQKRRGLLQVPNDDNMLLDPQAMNPLKVNSVQEFSDVLERSVLKAAEDALPTFTEIYRSWIFSHSSELGPVISVENAYWDYFALWKPDLCVQGTKIEYGTESLCSEDPSGCAGVV